MSADGYFVGDQNKLIEISVPIILRPLMKEILSIGKSIKIIRFLDHSSKEQFESLIDFKSTFMKMKAD